ncbi:glycosyltransferase [Sediminihabitans luteus]|uniref:glycosyltransferase n=1 Tax=Sediminihabitans luteus TaxID=1138585 RepID=UPI0012FDE524|nr:glycosyltransferase [Sediminihabitans luteus]
MPTNDLQRLAVTSDPRRRAVYWRGAPEVRDGALRVGPGDAVDLGTWLNAAPVGWWRELLGPGHVRLRLRGRGTVSVWASEGGTARRVDEVRLDGTAERSLPRTDAVDWYWLRLEADERGGVLEEATWTSGGGSGRGHGRESRVTVVMPTFGREADCLAQVRRLLSEPLRDTVGRVVVIDQGGGLTAAPGADALDDDRVVLVEQPNLGGSGGYGRGMVESLRWPDDPVLLLDDDAEIEPESLRRIHVLGRLSPRPTILGTGMLSAEDPTTLVVLTDVLRPRTFQAGPAGGLGGGADVAHDDPASWTFARPSDRAGYTGWWGTYLPAGTVAKVGLPAPYFLKWDDTEYGLRAARAGLRIATLPGHVVWHPTWLAKGTSSSWSAVPLHRNRVATAAAYGAGYGVLVDSLVHQVKHVLSLQYATAMLWDVALAEVLGGPGWLREDLTAVRPRAQRATDAAPTPVDPGYVADGTPDRGAAGLAAAAARAVLGLVVPVRPRRGGCVEIDAPADLGWRTGLGRDVVRFTAPTGGGEVPAPLVRDPAAARRALRRTLGLHWRLARRWRALRTAYAQALPESVTREAWDGRFGDVSRST